MVVKRLRKECLIGFVLLLFVIGCKKKEEVQLPIVIVDKPAKEDVYIYGEYMGRIRAASYVEIHARVEGYLESMLFEEGKHVKRNDPLFMINPAPYKARVEKAKAQLKKDEAQAAKARRDVDRLRPLYEQHAASQLDLDNATAALENAEANIAMSKADLDQAQLELGYTTVTSPLSGYISERFVDIGALVGPGVNSKLAAVVKSDTVLVDFKMTALDYLRAERRNIRFGEQDSTRSWQPTVTITLADDTEYPIKGVVDFADPLVDPQSGTFGVRAELANPNQRLLPGQFTRVKLLLDVRERAIVVPRKALSIESGGAFIYIIRRDGIAEKRFVQTGPEIGNNIVVERGLGDNEDVVIEGYHKLTPGLQVRPVRAGDEEAVQLMKEEDTL
ncbi:efflux RND transporter periplasmic adaptor subunit [Parabacteroides sp. 52]|uniref:efflux RND transporter periplasmic adaptor subunit n=1 Tax=unclassified Parabacteroides TaxID=2649774 RepID=UPI0013D3ADCA|nr:MULTISPECIES: efflux RND transporter periplasmic adaptor subunit [unclassified Parabacteroides]MDH6533846.1 membrane fusion protein (multidrug efflux system) [Parabacteroides sp. PM5-20]NDV54593.1 efflux RND transporter periplasmic adaptor subunit [Parabacteroides sp. 52]